MMENLDDTHRRLLPDALAAICDPGYHFVVEETAESDVVWLYLRRIGASGNAKTRRVSFRKDVLATAREMLDEAHNGEPH